MRKVVFLPTARADLEVIRRYIARRSGYINIAKKFVAKFRDACRKYAAIPGTIGRARPNLRPDIRSIPYENYVIFFRYIDDKFQVINILEGHRDMDGFFRRSGLNCQSRLAVVWKKPFFISGHYK